MESDADTSGTLAHQGDLVWIAAKSFDVRLDPLQGKVLKKKLKGSSELRLNLSSPQTAKLAGTHEQSQLLQD